MNEERANESWQLMGVGRLLFTLAGVAALIAIVLYVACSRATGFGLLLSVVMGWLAFGTIVGLGAPLSILVWFVAETLLFFVRNHDTKERIYLGLRWIVFLTGLGALLYLGGRGVYDGMQNNRLVEPQVLYDRCAEPQWRTAQVRWQECSDGWRSPSIGHRGACSHHGGVVWRMIERKERYRAHSAEYCRADAAARSWLD